MEYRGIEFPANQEIFHQKFETGTNNIGEFLAIVHALAFCQKNNSLKPIYSDSKIAILWVNKKKCNTKIEGKKSTPLKEVIKRAENWLKTKKRKKMVNGKLIMMMRPIVLKLFIKI